MEADCKVQITLASASEFDGYDAVLGLLRDSFAYMEGRIDPPSSLHRIDMSALRLKVESESLFVAVCEGHIVGCVFAAIRPQSVYLGKLAVNQAYRGKGIARQLIESVESLARKEGINQVDIETRVELTENQRLFEHMGYTKIAENSHPGYTRTTSFYYRKSL